MRRRSRECWAGCISSAGTSLSFVRVCGPKQEQLTLRTRSGSFYPQPISNFRRKSTLGLAIDFPTLNVLGFSCYTISTAAFLYSPTIRSQYAYRHPSNAETTVRFNDFLFAGHGAILCVIIYSQFFPAVWGFKVGSRQKASRAALGIFWGSILGILIVALLAQTWGKDGGYDPEGWAWIDVVSVERGYIGLACADFEQDLCTGICQAHYRRGQVHAPGVGEL